MATTPGERGDLEGRLVILSMEVEEQKGEAEKEEFRIVKFAKRKPDTISLAEVVVDVHLFSSRYSSFFKATFDDPARVVADHKIDMGTIVYTLEEILRGGVENVVMSYERVDGKEFMFIKTKLEAKIFVRTVTFEFCYKFEKTKMSLEERINMKIGELAILFQEHKIEKGEQRLKAIEKFIEDVALPSHPPWFIAGKPTEGAQFDVSRNNYSRVSDNGMTLTHHANSGYNTTPVNINMKTTDAHRARFRIASHTFNNMMLGVISTSFSKYTNYPSGAGQYGWVANFYSNNLQTSYQHNGSFLNSGGPTPFAGSVVTVEFYPKQNRIQYFVNSTPVAQHTGCSFNNGDCRFVVALHDVNTVVKLLCVEQIPDDF